MPVDKELVEQLVVQILGQLSDGKHSENILVLGNRAEASQIRLPQSGDTKVKLYCEGDAYNAEEIDRYILPHLELEDMADLAAGKATSGRAKDVLSLLLHGKTVEVHQYAYTSFEETAPGKLYQLYCDYAATLSDFGLCPLQKKVQKSKSIHAGVLSEKDIEKCGSEGITRIRVSGKTLVTSLAEESAKKFGIEIQRD